MSNGAVDTMRDRAASVVREIQQQVSAAVEALDGERFVDDAWERPGGGGGSSKVLQQGRVFEKAGINVSVVHGPLAATAAEAMTARVGWSMTDGTELRFYATGVSAVLHPRNPMAPTAHFNYRYFELEAPGQPPVWWFGGGADLTPAYLFEADVVHFHRVHKEACDRHDPGFYDRFKRACDAYFRIPHRGETRGVGGIFFDDLNDRPAERLLALCRDCGGAFEQAYLPLVRRRKDSPFTPRQRHWQLLRRGRYVEFNLLYDRGTAFGLRTGGRTESILMSLPAEARWDYDYRVEPDSDEARLVEVLRQPRDWVAPGRTA